ncbi:MAG: sugar transferase [Atopobiaceae bacterium]|nr:sugar transferase [Atopobiaceae bacterium]
MYTRNARGWTKHLDFMLWDVVCLELAFTLAYALRHGMSLLFRLPAGYRSIAIVYAILDILVAVAFSTMHNVLKRGPYRELVQTVKQVVMVLLCIVLYMFVVHTGDYYSRITVFLTAGLHLVLGYSVRMIWKHLLRSRGIGHARSTMVLVCDEGRVAEVLGNVLPASNIVFAGVVLTNRNACGEEVEGLPVVANLDGAADYLVREWVDEVFVYPTSLTQFMDEGSVSGLVDLCCQMSIPVHVRLPLNNVGSKSFTQRVAGYTVLTLASNYASSLQMALKRCLDILGGLVGSILALLIMLVVGPMIKIASPGPILFKQTRVGLNGRRFQMYKLRSMYMDAEERKKELQEQNRVSDGMMFKLDWDPRIIGNRIVDGERKTGIGEFIRKTSLDEFPQFFNVLLGQMSLVGTRPPTIDEWEKYEYHHRARLATKPGITGMWQVSGRSNITDFEEVVRLDTEYIQHWSLGLDLKILAKTIAVVFAGRGAM